MLRNRVSIRRISIVFLIALTVMLISSPVKPGSAQSQIVNAPIVFHIGAGFQGDLWEWQNPDGCLAGIDDGTGTCTDLGLKQLTNWHYNFDPVLSPDGKKVAYLSLPRFGVQNLKGTLNYLTLSPLVPSNIWVLDLASGNATQITDQPTDASYDNGVFVVRSIPVWSPDSAGVAWGEQINTSQSDYSYRLVRYDLAAVKQIVVTTKLPDDLGKWNAETVGWGNNELTYLINDQILIFSPQGTLIANMSQKAGFCNWTGTISLLWIAVAGQSRIEICVGHKDHLIDPVNQQIEDFPAHSAVRVYSSQSLQGLNFASIDTGADRAWDVFGNIVPDGQMGLSSDGKYVAYLQDQQLLSVFDASGNSFPVKFADNTEFLTKDVNGVQMNFDWMAWSPTAIRLGSAAAQ